MNHTFKKGTVGLGLGVLLLTGRAAADDKVVLTGKLPPAGLVAVETGTNEMKDMPMTIAMQGQDLSGTMTQKAVTTETTTYQGPDKFTKELNSSVIEGSVTMNGQANPTPNPPNPLEKVPVTFERKDGKWVPSLANGDKLTDLQSKALTSGGADKPFEADAAMYGTDPHKVGDKWDVDATKMPTFGSLSKVTGTMKCELVEVKEVQGMKAAVIKLSFDISGAPDTGAEGGPEIKIHMTGEGTTTRSLDYAIDLESTLKAQMDMKGTVAPGVEMKVSGPMTMSRSITVKKP